MPISHIRSPSFIQRPVEELPNRESISPSYFPFTTYAWEKTLLNMKHEEPSPRIFCVKAVAFCLLEGARKVAMNIKAGWNTTTPDWHNRAWRVLDISSSTLLYITLYVVKALHFLAGAIIRPSIAYVSSVDDKNTSNLKSQNAVAGASTS